MNKGKTIFSQIMSLIPERDFKACVDRYKGNYRSRNFSCKDQFLVMSYAQLTGRDSLRDIENCLSALSSKLYHCGIIYAVSRNTLAKANEKREWLRMKIMQLTTCIGFSQTTWNLKSATIIQYTIKGRFMSR